MDRTHLPGRLPALLLAAALTLAWAAAAEEGSPEAPPRQGPAGPFGVRAELDWSRRSLDFRVDLNLAAFGLRLPQGRAEAESRIAAELPSIVKDLVLGIPVDSRRDLAACIADGSIGIEELKTLADKAEPRASTFAKDFRSFGVDYSLPLGEIETLLVRHRTALLPEAPIEGRASRAYTGIVIYARASLPVRGERTVSSLEPCLFPRIYDDSMRLVLDRNTVAPEALAAWGELSWATDLDRASLARVGEDPLRIDAQAYFGNRRTDIILPRDEVLKILVLPENLALLSRGRVLVVVEATRAPVAAPSYPPPAPAARD